MRELATEPETAVDQIKELSELLSQPMNRKQRRALIARFRKAGA